MTIHNGIDVKKYSLNTKGKEDYLKQKYQIDRDAFLIGTVGRLSVEKGYQYLLVAFKALLVQHPHCQLIFIGDGDLREFLKEKARGLGISKQVVFAGIETDMVKVYQSFDLLVMSSITEGLPLVILEALAMQRPVVATDVGGISKVVHDNHTGWLIEPRNVAALTNAMCELMIDQRKAKILAKNGRRLIEEKFSAAAMASNYKSVYDQLKMGN